MSETLNDKMKRLEAARKKAEELSQKRLRLAGELDGHSKRLAELEAKCRTDYDCEVSELPTLINQLEDEASKAISEAERILSVPAAQSSVPVALAVSTESPKQVDVKQSQPTVLKKTAIQPSSKPSVVSEDEDAIL